CTAADGAWKVIYGHVAALIATVTGSITPSEATVTHTDGPGYAWNAFHSELRSLQRLDLPQFRAGVGWYADPGFAIDVNITDGLSHQVALYLLDYDRLARNETIAVLDAVTGSVL